MSSTFNPELIAVAFDIGAALARRLIDMVLKDEDWSPIIDLLPDVDRARHRQTLARLVAKARFEQTRHDALDV